MLTETKFFFFLLLSGAIAVPIATECVVPKDGEKYYIKIKGSDNRYGYAFGDSVGENKYAQMYAWSSTDLAKMKNLYLQEFTFEDNTLFAEKGKDDKTVKYFVGLKKQGVKHKNISMPVWDKKLYVAQANAQGIRSQKVELKSDKSIVFGNDQSGVWSDPSVVLKIQADGSYLPTNNKVEIENAYNVTKDPKICFVTEKTAAKDYVTLVEEYILKELQTKLDQESKMMKEVLRDQLKKKLTSLEVPFSIEKTKAAKAAASTLFHGVTSQMDALENSDEIKKMIDDSEMPKDDLLKEHLMNYKAHLPAHVKNFEESEKENLKVDINAFHKLVLSKLSKEKLENYSKMNQGGTITPDNVKEVNGEVKNAPTGKADGGKDAAEAEGKTGKGDSGKKSVAVASAFAAILFFL